MQHIVNILVWDPEIFGEASQHLEADRHFTALVREIAAWYPLVLEEQHIQFR